MSVRYPSPPNIEDDRLRRWADDLIRALEAQQRSNPDMPVNSVNYQLTNVSILRNFDVSAGATTVEKVLATLLQDLQRGGVVG